MPIDEVGQQKIDRMLRVTEVMYRLGVSRAKVYSLLSDRKLRHIKIDKCVRIPESAVEELVKVSHVD